MKNRLFHKGLYFEALRQTRVIGILLFVITEVTVALSFWYDCILLMNSGPILSKSAVDLGQINPLLFLMMHVAAVALPIASFYFLNKRSQSDFYHSIPHRRETIAFSFIMAIITWFLIISVISTLSAVALFGIFLSKYLIFNFLSILIKVISIFIMSLLVTAAYFLAMSMSGTLLTNVIVANIILYVPRMFISWISMVIDNVPTADTSHLIFPFGSYNMLYNYWTHFFNGSCLVDTSSILYTACLAILYFCIGFIVFTKRKSESAEQAAPSPFIQAAYRIIITMVVSLIPTLLLTNKILEKDTFTAEDIFTFVSLYIVAIIAFFVYEIISTRSAKTLVKIIPTLLIVVVLNFFFAGVASISYNSILNNNPTAEEIQSISFVDNGFGLYDGYDEQSYFEMKTYGIVLTGDDTKKEVARTLQHMIHPDEEKATNPTKEVFYTYDDIIVTKVAKIKLKNGHTIYRKLDLDSTANGVITTELMQNKQYTDCYFNLPDESNPHVSAICTNLNEQNSKKVYKSLKEEIKTIDKTKWILSVEANCQSYEAPNIILTTYVGFRPASGSLPLTPELKNTYTLYLDCLKEEADNANWKELLKRDPETDDNLDYIAISIYPANELSEEDNYYISFSDTSVKQVDDFYPLRNELYNWLLETSNNRIDITKPYCHVEINYYDKKTDYNIITFYVQSDKVLGRDFQNKIEKLYE